MKKIIGMAIILAALLLQSCQFDLQPGITSSTNSSLQPLQEQNFLSKELRASPQATNTPANSVSPEAEPTSRPAAISVPDEESPGGLLGPENFPGGINPLTGLPVTQIENLNIPPALVSITNWPPKSRPQAGLSFSPLVFELFIGEGMTRFLALFYGDFPSEVIQSEQPVGSEQVVSDSSEIGPIRSGRLPYESLRKFYNGFLVMASAYSGVTQNLGEHTNIFGSDEGDINSAMISVSKLADIARANKARLGNAELTGMAFDPAAPAGGKPAQRFWLMYNAIDQILWKYDAESGTYHRYQDNADGVNFVQAVDRLNGEALTYENVVVLFVNHRYCTESAFDLDIMYVDRQKGLAFRDGKLHEIYWTTKNGEYEKKTGKVRPIRFIDANGNPFPLKPGQSWVHIVPIGTPYWETEDTMDLYHLLNNRQPGSGNWAMRFYPNLMVYDVKVCEKLRPK